MTRKIHMLGLAAAVSLAAAPAAARDVPAVHRLSPEAIEAARATGESRSRAAEALALDDEALALDDAAGPGGRKVHGEVGFGIGTGGGREAFGTAVVPLGENATGIVSYDYSRFGDRRDRRRDR